MILLRTVALLVILKEIQILLKHTSPIIMNLLTTLIDQIYIMTRIFIIYIFSMPYINQQLSMCYPLVLSFHLKLFPISYHLLHYLNLAHLKCHFQINC